MPNVKMVDINTVSIAGWVEHLRYGKNQDGEYAVVNLYQNVMGKRLSSFNVMLDAPATEELHKLHLKKNDRIFVTNAMLLESKKQEGKEQSIVIFVSGAGHISVLGRESQNRGEKSADEFM